MLEYDTENMNSEEILSSLKGVTEAIQSFSFRSKEDILEPIKHDGKREDTVSFNTCKTVFKMLLQRESGWPKLIKQEGLHEFFKLQSFSYFHLK